MSCTGFCSKNTQLYSPTIWTESELGSLSQKEHCTSRINDNFEVVTEALRVLRKLHPKTLNRNWAKKGTWTQKSRNTERWITTTPNLTYFIQLCALHSTGNAFSHNVNWVRSTFTFRQRSVSLTVHWQLRDRNWSISCTQRTWSRIAIHKLTKKLHLNTEKSQFTNTQHKDPERYWIFRAKRSIKTSPNLIYFSQLCSAFYIPLTPVIVKKVSRYTTTQLYSPTMWTEPDLGSISHKV